MMMASIKRIQLDLKKQNRDREVQILSFSTTPEHDTSTELKKYARDHGFDLSNWSLLTGSSQEIYRLGRSVFKADASIEPKKTSFIHTSSLYLVDPNLKIRGIYDTTNTKQMADLKTDIHKLVR
jgi:protein SCO1/2